MFKKNFLFAFVAITLVITISCNKEKKLFTALAAESTSINFQNNINETDSFNILDYLYFYNGGGVGIGDINNDGLQDIYVSHSGAFQDPAKLANELWINQGVINGVPSFKDEASVY